MEFNWLNTFVVTVEGLLIVFAVLLIIMLVLYALKLFAKEESAKTPAAPAASKAPTIHTVSDKDAESLEESELIAIFSGAIAGYLDVPVEGISISSYKKIN